MSTRFVKRLRRDRFAFFRTPLRLRCEQLEDRAVPANLFAVDPSQYESTDILVRFRPDVQASNLVGSNFEQGTDIGDTISLVSGLRKVHLGPGISVSDALAIYQASPYVMYA